MWFEVQAGENLHMGCGVCYMHVCMFIWRLNRMLTSTGNMSRPGISTKPMQGGFKQNASKISAFPSWNWASGKAITPFWFCQDLNQHGFLFCLKPGWNLCFISWLGRSKIVKGYCSFGPTSQATPSKLLPVVIHIPRYIEHFDSMQWSSRVGKQTTIPSGGTSNSKTYHLCQHSYRCQPQGY